MCIQVPMLNVGYWLRYTVENLYNIFYERASILSHSLTCITFIYFPTNKLIFFRK